MLINVFKRNAKSYIFKDAPRAERSIGFIAHEVAEVFPEIVEGVPNGEDLLSLD